MAIFLYRLGRAAFRRRRLVVFVWLALLVAGVVGTVTLSSPSDGGFSIPGTESQRTGDLLNERFPKAKADSATARVVFEAPDGGKLSEPANRALLTDAVRRLSAAPQVGAVTDPFTARGISADGQIGYAQVAYEVAAKDVTPEARAAVKAAIEPARAAGLTVEYGGNAMDETEPQHLSEIIGVGVAAVVLLITFGSLVAAGMPLLSAIIGVGIGVTAISTASGFFDVASTTSVLAVMIGLAVSIDYALLIVSRYRQELSAGLEPEDAVGHAVGTAGSAVVFAGLTVVIALAGLAVVGIPFLTQMGLAAALTVLLAVAIALTFLPAMLGMVGSRIRGPRKTPVKPVGRRWVELVTRRPVAVLVAMVICLGAVAVPAFDLQLGLPNDSTAKPGSSQREAYELLSKGFGPGFNGPLLVVVDAAASADPKAAVASKAAAVRTLPHVAMVAPPTMNPAGNTALMTVIPTEGPSATETTDLVNAIRDLPRMGDGATVSVTGATAVNIDVSAKLGAALLPYLLLIVGLAFLLLMLVFRSVLIPLKATLGFLLTIAATFGALVAVFQWGWFAGLFGVEGQTGPILSMLPIFMIGVVFGLAMDYQVFLVTRMREAHVHGATPKGAVVEGFSQAARVVTAAAIIMIAVFSGFILSSDTMFRELGFGLAAAVAIDAFVVRMTLVPAAMALLGRHAWWLPGWLNRRLPDVDVEGETLQRGQV
ncbi:MMPL family transporter [Kribbella yunnanensis]|uniref:MMPL family transporter n=1 Tax=Kribbella yunnanensis TaxID=190194 RepID=A0ABN2I103_9ACTN